MNEAKLNEPLFRPEDVVEFLADFKYKEGWKHEYLAPPHDQHYGPDLGYFVVRGPQMLDPKTGEDARGNHRVAVAIPHGMTRFFLAMKIRDGIKSAEVHEMDEWLTIGGEHIMNPHPNEPGYESLREERVRGYYTDENTPPP